MFGYTEEGRPFVASSVDLDDAERIAGENDLAEYILVPRRPGNHDHLGRRRNPEGEYKPILTRIAVFGHLLDPAWDRVPTKEEIEAGYLFD